MLIYIKDNCLTATIVSALCRASSGGKAPDPPQLPPPPYFRPCPLVPWLVRVICPSRWLAANVVYGDICSLVHYVCLGSWGLYCSLWIVFLTDTHRTFCLLARTCGTSSIIATSHCLCFCQRPSFPRHTPPVLYYAYGSCCWRQFYAHKAFL